MLNFIQKTLGIGIVSTSGAQSYFDVRKEKDVARIIEIFSNYPLNTHKHLNFLDFKKAYGLYTSTKKKTLELIQEIEKIKSGMNTQRSDFGIESREFRITPY